MTISSVYGVLSGSGGAGGSAFAAMLAGRAATLGERPVVLLDGDRLGGGIDVLLGCERVPGPRWRQVRLTGGTFDATDLLRSLPRWGRVSFLAADTGDELDPAALAAVIAALAGAATVVVDIPRWPGGLRDTALSWCDRVVMVLPAEVRAVAAGAVLAASALGDPVVRVRSRLAVRGSGAALSAAQIADVLELPLIGPVPYEPALAAGDGFTVDRLRRATRRVVDAALDGGPADDVMLAAEPAA